VADDIIDNPSAKFRELFEKIEHLPDAHGVDRLEAFKKLNELGVERFLEMVAKGRLLPEIAISLEVPVTYLDEWVRHNVDAAALSSARKLSAEAHVLKSLLPLLVTYDSPGHATVAKALSERMAWIAQRLDPDRWGDVKPSKVPNMPVNLVFNLGGEQKVEMKEAQVLEEKPRSAEETLALLHSADVVVEGDSDE